MYPVLIKYITEVVVAMCVLYFVRSLLDTDRSIPVVVNIIFEYIFYSDVRIYFTKLTGTLASNCILVCYNFTNA